MRMHHSAHIAFHMIRICRTELAVGIRRRRRNTLTANRRKLTKQGARHRMRWTTQSNGFLCCQCMHRDCWPPRKNEAKRAWPKCSDHAQGKWVELCPTACIGQTRNMDDERVIAGSLLECEQGFNGSLLGCISAQAINRFGGKSHNSPATQMRCSFMNFGGIGRKPSKVCLFHDHDRSSTFSACSSA